MISSCHFYSIIPQAPLSLESVTIFASMNRTNAYQNSKIKNYSNGNKSWYFPLDVYVCVWLSALNLVCLWWLGTPQCHFQFLSLAENTANERRKKKLFKLNLICKSQRWTACFAKYWNKCIDSIVFCYIFYFLFFLVFLSLLFQLFFELECWMAQILFSIDVCLLKKNTTLP